MKNAFITFLISALLAFAPTTVRAQQGANPNYYQFRTRSGSQIGTPTISSNVKLYYDGTGFFFKKSDGTSTPIGGGASLPVADTQTLVKGSADDTKLLRFEVDGFTTGTTRVVTFPDADITVARIDAAQTFTGAQTFNNQILSGLAFGGNPSFSFSGDSDTGIGNPAANSIGFVEGANERARLTTSVGGGAVLDLGPGEIHMGTALNGGGLIISRTSGDIMTVNNGILPSVNTAYPLGGTSNQWSAVYANAFWAGTEFLTFTINGGGTTFTIGRGLGTNGIVDLNSNLSDMRLWSPTQIVTRARLVLGDGSIGGDIQARSGSASAPTYTFVTDASTNTGFFLQAEDKIGATTGGTERWRLSSAGVDLGPNTVLFGTTIGTPQSGIKQTSSGILLFTDGSTGNGSFQVASGTLSNPGMAFQENPDTGVEYVVATTLLNLVLDGTAKIKIGATKTQTAQNITTTSGDTYDLGGSGEEFRSLYITRSVQGASSKTLTDNTATAFATVAVPNSDTTVSGSVSYVFFCKDASHVVQSEYGVLPFVAVNENGTVSVTLGTPSVLATDNGGATFTNSFSATVSSTTVTLKATSDTSLTPTGFTIFHRGNINSGTATYTPQ